MNRMYVRFGAAITLAWMEEALRQGKTVVARFNHVKLKVRNPPPKRPRPLALCG